MNEIVIYQAADGHTKIKTKLENDTIWLSQQQLAELYQTERTNVTMHIKNIFTSGELEEKSVCKDFLHTAADDKNYKVKHYNLDMIISLGYRINSKTATIFRQWATQRLNEYIRKGFTMDDERLKNLGGGDYWKELLARIRDIRSSEKVMYRQVLDLYATSLDYDPKAAESIKLFQIIQNKLHYAAHGHTAAEIIYYRVDSDKPFLGLTNFAGKKPVQAEALIAKNYLNETELKVLNNIVSGYFDLAEISAIEHKPMYMKDHIEQLDRQLKAGRRQLLQSTGTISHQKAVKKATAEYRKYDAKNLSAVEEAYLASLKQLTKTTNPFTPPPDPSE